MSAFGSGSRLWRVDVVLRGINGDEHIDAVLGRLREYLSPTPDMPDEAVFANVEETGSYDMDPPDGSLGVSMWVRADAVGEAVQTGTDAVVAACAQMTGRSLELWDVRVLPRSAVIERDSDWERLDGEAPFDE
jgi:hypothetical protein